MSFIRDIIRGHPLAQDMQVQWRIANNQSPATSPITTSGHHAIQNPSLEVLVLKVIQILTATKPHFTSKVEHLLLLLPNPMMMKVPQL